MTEIAFHFGLRAPLPYAARLLRKAVGQGAQALVVGDAPTLEALDAHIWQLGPTDFIGHHWLRDDAPPPQTLPPARVWLCAHTRFCTHHHNVLVHLGAEVPEGFERFDKLIEIVSENQADRSAGRKRWKHYTNRGYTIVTHDVAGRA